VKIHAVFSQPHYRDHLYAIHSQLPDGIRGNVYGTRFRMRELPAEDLVMVAGFSDIQLAPNNRIVFVEHGAGQRYVGVPAASRPFYGGPYPSQVIAYLGPRQVLVDSVGLPGVAIGAPICDPYELTGEEGVCAITWHWKAKSVCPEADTALKHYIADLPGIVDALRAAGWEVLGHRHPRLRGHPNLWKNVGVEEVDVYTVRRRASLLVSDNTSLAYEMAYLMRQNITLNAPWYRPDVEHGLRFWENPPGAQFDNPDELIDAVGRLENHLPRTYSTRAAEAAYGKVYNDGNDGMRAATWLLGFTLGL
jgi:hypothetical protein